MRYILLLFWTLVISTALLGQANDCATATTICANPPPSGNPQGNGGYDDFSDPDNDPGCLSSEGNTAWFYFEIEAGAPSGLTLEFSIIPDGGYGEDYDWALFGPDVDCGDLGSPIRCSSAAFNCAFCPETGLGMGATDYSEGPGFGDGFVAPLTVNGGEGYYIAINNWYGTGNGFTMTFGGDAAQYMDCVAQPPCSVAADASDDITICEGGDPIQVNVIPDGGLPPYTFSWDGSGDGGNYISDPSVQDPFITIPIGVTGSYTYYVTVTDGICEAVDSLLLQIFPTPEITIDPLGPFCTNDQTSIQATGTPQNGQWGGIANPLGVFVPSNFNNGVEQLTLSTVSPEGCPGTETIDVEFFDPEDINVYQIDPLCESSDPYKVQVDPPGGVWSGDITPDGTIYPDLLGPGTFVGTYEYTSIYGCESIEQVVFDIYADPEPMILDPGPLCMTNNTVQIDADPPGGSWSATPDINGNVFPSFLGVGSYSAIYTYWDANGCMGADTITLEIIAEPFADLPPDVFICNSDAGGQTTLLDFSTLILGGDPSGTWTDVDGSGAAGPFPVLDFFGVMPGVYTFEYTTNSALGDCPEFTGTVSVVVENCECPSVALNPLTLLCEDQADLDLTTIKITLEAGTFTISSVPPGSDPATVNGDQFLGTGKDPGLYQIRFDLSIPPPAGCPTFGTAQIEIKALPTATLTPSVQVCNQFGTGSFPSTLDLYTLITSGDGSGTWQDLDASGATGPANAKDFVGTTPGSYTFTYTTGNAVAPCQNVTYNVEVIVNDCNCPSTAFSSPPDLCNDQGSLDLNALLQTTEPGTWSITATPSGSNPVVLAGTLFQANGKDPGPYMIRFTLTTPPPAGCPDHSEQLLTVVPTPFATLTPQLAICNSNTSGTDPTTLDFSDFILGGDASGTWTDDAGSGASGSWPILDFTGITPGLYPFTYTTASATPPCTDQSYTVNVLVKNCLCPDLDILASIDLCNSTADLDLSSLINQAAPGIWSLSGIPAGSNPATLNGSILTIQDRDAGPYTLTYTLQPTPPAGCPTETSAILKLADQPAGGLALPPTNFCEGMSAIQDLNDLISGSDPGGSWAVSSGPALPSGAFNAASGEVTVQGLPAGTYGFTYMITATPPCQNTVTPVSLIVHPNPIASAGADQTISCLDPTVSIGPAQAPAPGLLLSWNGPGLNGNTNTNPVINSPGTYVLTVTDPTTGCSATDNVVVSGSNDLITGISVEGQGNSCPGSTDGYLEVLAIQGGTAPYTYSLNGGTPNNTGFFAPLSGGTYQILVQDNIGCTRDTTLTLVSGNGFSLDLGPDLEVLAGTTVPVQALINPPGTSLTVLDWNPAPPDGCSTCTGFTFTASQDITYSLTATDLNGCTASDQVTIRVTLPRRVFIPSAFSPNGDGLNDIFFVQGGSEVLRVISLQVFDRWGNAIFRRDDTPVNDIDYGWDGTFRGRFVSQEVYVYTAEVEFVDGTTRLYKGDVLISDSLSR